MRYHAAINTAQIRCFVRFFSGLDPPTAEVRRVAVTPDR